MQSAIIAEEHWKLNTETKPLAWRRRFIYVFTAFAIAVLTVCLTSPAQASNSDPTNMVTNGGFETLTGPGTLGTNGASQLGLGSCPTVTTCGVPFPLVGSPGGSLPGGAAFPLLSNWTVNSGLTFLFSGNGSVGAADGSGAPFQFSAPIGSTQTFQLWSTTNCGMSCNGNEVNLPAACPFAGCGNNFVVMDSDPGNAGLTPPRPGVFQGSITQNITGLVQGDEYAVHFFTASGQQQSLEGPTMTQLGVSLCGSGQTAAGPGTTIQPTGMSGCTFFTTPRSNPDHGFQPWTPMTILFTASAAQEALTFLAIGSPASSSEAESVPPAVLLDGVSLAPVPEPATWSLIVIGFAVITLVGYWRGKRVSVPD